MRSTNRLNAVLLSKKINVCDVGMIMIPLGWQRGKVMKYFTNISHATGPKFILQVIFVCFPPLASFASFPAVLGESYMEEVRFCSMTT